MKNITEKMTKRRNKKIEWMIFALAAIGAALYLGSRIVGKFDNICSMLFTVYLIAVGLTISCVILFLLLVFIFDIIEKTRR